MGWVASLFSTLKAEVEWLITSLAVASGTETPVSGDTQQQADSANPSRHDSNSSPDTVHVISSLVDQQADNSTADHSGTQHVTSDAFLSPSINVQVADVATGHPANLLLSTDFLIDTAESHQIAQDSDAQNAGSDAQAGDIATHSPLLLDADFLIDTTDHSGPASSPGLTPTSFESGVSDLSSISTPAGTPTTHDQDFQLTLPENDTHPAIATPNPDAGQFALASLAQQTYGFAHGGGGGGGTSNGGDYSHHDIISAPGLGSTLTLHLDNSLYNLSRTNAPLYAAITGDLQKVVDFFSSHFNNSAVDSATDPANGFQMNVGWGEDSITALASGELGKSDGFLYAANYSQVQTAFGIGPNPAAGTVTYSEMQNNSPVVNIPSSEPFGSNTIMITGQEIHALGITSLIGTGLHFGGIGFSSAPGSGLPGTYGTQFFFNPAQPVAGAYDFEGIALHEITEQLGRLTKNDASGQLTLLDLFHFADGTNTPIDSAYTGYFSVDNGQNNLMEFNNNPLNGDAGDWATPTDAFSANPSPAPNPAPNPETTPPAGDLPFTYADYLAMEAIGFVGTFTGSASNWINFG